MIKKHYKLIIFLLVILMIFLIYKANHNHYFNYTSLGDGYALGINSYGEIDYGYSDFIKDKLQKEKKLKLYIKDFSDKNQSVERLYETIVTNEKITVNNIERNIKQILRESDLITMTVGLNDLVYHIAITPNMNEYELNKIVSDIEENLEKLIKEIKKYYPKKIYIIGYPEIPIQNTYIREGIKKLNTSYQKIDEISYISTSEIVTSKDFLNPNSIFPSKEAYEKISKEVLKKLAKEKNN